MSVAKVAAVVVASAAVLATASTASARGCNGVVNQFEWGCAAWDNNNGPQYPHWKGPAARQSSKIEIDRSAPPRSNPSLTSGMANRNGAGVISAGGGNLISHDGGSLISHDGGSFGH